MEKNDIETEDTGSVFIIRLPMCVDISQKAKIETLQTQWLLSSARIFILDFSRVLMFQKIVYPLFAQISQTLRKNDKRLFSHTVNEKIVRDFKAEGMTQVFNPMKSMDEILISAGMKKKATVSLDTNFIGSFITATIDVLKIQARVEVTPGKPILIKTKGEESNISIAAVITMISKSFTGTISIEFPTQVFLKIYEGLLGEEYKEITDEIKDGAAEILNMIYGQAKTDLNNKNYHLDKALPTILLGDKLKVHHDQSATCLRIPMTSTAGDFYLQVSLNS